MITDVGTLTESRKHGGTAWYTYIVCMCSTEDSVDAYGPQTMGCALHTLIVDDRPPCTDLAATDAPWKT